MKQLIFSCNQKNKGIIEFNCVKLMNYFECEYNELYELSEFRVYNKKLRIEHQIFVLSLISQEIVLPEEFEIVRDYNENSDL